MNLIVQIPDKLAARLGASGPNLERQALEALVIQSYRAGRMTTEDLREALGFEVPGEVDGFLRVHGVVEAVGIGKGSESTVTVPAEEYARLKRRDRQVHRVEDLPEEIINQIARTEMDPRHNHLNELLKDWAP